jgi:hypothetical protein
MKPGIYFYFLVCLLNLTACEKSGKDVTPSAPNQPQAGYATGKVVDILGNPIQGAEITANNTGNYSNNVVGYTDANGIYKVKLRSGPLVGSFYIRGTAKVRYDGQTYTLPLFTEDDGAFDPDKGAIKNLRLKTSGKRTGNFGDEGYYGGQAEVDNWTQATRFSDIELTFKPVGPLIDGSTGKTFITKLNGYYADDVPLGKYTISARQLSTNKPLAIRIRNKGQEYTQSTIGKFEPAYEGAQRFHMMIQIKDL